MKISLRNEGGRIKTFLDEGKLRTCHQQTYSESIAKGRSLHSKELIKEGTKSQNIRKEDRTW